VIASVAGLIFVVLWAAIVLYALTRKREVKAGLRIPFVTIFFEANDHGQDPQPPPKQINGR
jgi:hypothetical protein